MRRLLAAYLVAALVALGWFLRGLDWRAMRREPYLAGALALAVVGCGAAVWPVAIPLARWVLGRRRLLAP